MRNLKSVNSKSAKHIHCSNESYSIWSLMNTPLGRHSSTGITSKPELDLIYYMLASFPFTVYLLQNPNFVHFSGRTSEQWFSSGGDLAPLPWEIFAKCADRFVVITGGLLLADGRG